MFLSRLSLAAFLLTVSWHLGLSMELPLVAWIASALIVLAAIGVLNVERPTWGLLFVLFATGALTGNQVLEDWAIENTWPQENGFGAGIMISLLLFMVWSFAARPQSGSQTVVDRDTQNILVWGLLSLLMIRPTDAMLVNLFGQMAPITALIGMVLACITLLADRCGPMLWQRLLLLLPAFLVLPLALTGLAAGQGPLVAALGQLMPSPREYTPTGFSPRQTLRASIFLRPSNDPVMRIQTDALVDRYLAGNRLVSLNEELVWLPSERPVRSLSTIDAELLDNNQWRYPLANHHYRGSNAPSASSTVYSLNNSDYLFVTPGTSHVSGRFDAISRNAADVLTPNYERGADPRWQMEIGGNATPDQVNPETLNLPAFWDGPLQARAVEFAGADRQATTDNIVSYFLGRDYALQTDFDPQQPFHDFFLNERAGYCFWFASATTLALRANGIPSRLVGGYLVHEQLSEELWLVRERDAHSWVEWQDEQGYWHTVDPTPASMDVFFGGYSSSPASQWYHRLAGQWQMFIDRILENRLAANLVTWGGLAILVFLFVREYRRLRQRGTNKDQLGKRWQTLWQRFLRLTQLPSHPSWTATQYADNLPANWSPQRRASVQNFLQHYQQARFSATQETALAEMEQSLQTLKAVQ